MPELAAFPASTGEAGAEVTVAIVDAAVEANLRAPIPFMPEVPAAGEAPVTRGPKKSCAGRKNPVSGNPVVAIVAVLIVARRPDVAVARTGWLVENGNRGRRNTD